MRLKSIVNPAGGLYYHWKACRYSQKLWHPFRCEITSFLQTWKGSRRELILIGASSCYCLEWEFLSTFECLSLFDPDPLARVIFERRRRQSGIRSRQQIKWSSDDFFDLDSRQPRFEKFQRFLDQRPEAHVLFSNILGQIPLLNPNRDFLADLKTTLPALLNKRRWGTFHDRLSGSIKPQLKEGPFQSRSLRMNEITAHYYQNSGVGTLVDHDSDGFTPPHHPHRYFCWQLQPGTYHLIEGFLT